MAGLGGPELGLDGITPAVYLPRSLMRLIGNKARLLPSIERFLRERGITGGTLIDIFSGTANVGRHFKKLGFRVIANDTLAAGYTQAVAGVEVSRYPDFEPLRSAFRAVFESREFRQELSETREIDFGGNSASQNRRRDRSFPLREAVHYLSTRVPPREGLIFRNYCPGGPHGRRYFRDDHGRRIDGILHFLREARGGGLLSPHELHLLLAALIDAADRVANISGTYGAFLKTWQKNTECELRLVPPDVIESDQRNEAHQDDANRLIRHLKGDVLYIDPPYNRRQYIANYHVLEILAEHHRIADLEAYEAALYGKTGLRPYEDLRSHYCVRPGGRHAPGDNALTAFTDLVLSSRAHHVVVSYNEEGILSRDEIGAVLARFAGRRSFDFKRDLREIDFPRFRSDADRPRTNGGGGRRYSVLAGRDRNRLAELLYFASRPGHKRRSPGRSPVAEGGQEEFRT